MNPTRPKIALEFGHPHHDSVCMNNTRSRRVGSHPACRTPSPCSRVLGYAPFAPWRLCEIRSLSTNCTTTIKTLPMNVEFCRLRFARRSEKSAGCCRATDQKGRILSPLRVFRVFDQIRCRSTATSCDERIAGSKNKNQKTPSAKAFLIPSVQN